MSANVLALVSVAATLLTIADSSRVRPGAHLSEETQAPGRHLRELPHPAWSIDLSHAGFQSLPTSMLARANHLVFASARGLIRAVDTRSQRVAWSRTLSPDSVQPGTMFAAGPSAIMVAGRPDQAPVGLDAMNGNVSTRWQATNRVWLSACGRKDGGATVATVDDHSPLLRLDRQGRPMVGHGLPWPHLVVAHPLQRQAVLGPEAGGNRCVMALAASDGIALMRDGAVVWQGSFRTPVATTPVESTRTNLGRGRFTVATRLQSLSVAAFAAAVAGNMAFVAMGSPAPLGFRLIDVHDADDGRYLGSLVAPFRIAMLSANSRFLFLAANSSGHPTVFAYDLRAIERALTK